MNEKISALMDGELERPAADEALEALRREGTAADTWRVYHLVSDAMHEQPLLSEGFTRRVSDRLAAEPSVPTSPASDRLAGGSGAVPRRGHGARADAGGSGRRAHLATQDPGRDAQPLV